MKSPIKILSPFVRQLQLLFHLLGTRAFLPSGRLVRLFEKYMCEGTGRKAQFCENIFFLLSGSDPVNFNEDMLPIITSHTPAGTSTYTIIHYLQEYLSSKLLRLQVWAECDVQCFLVSWEVPAHGLGSQRQHGGVRTGHAPSVQFDDGHGTCHFVLGRKWLAGHTQSNKIPSPVFQFEFFKNSFEIFFKDVTWLAKRLGNLQGFYRVNFSEFNHLDFLWATNVDELLYYPLLQLLPADYWALTSPKVMNQTQSTREISIVSPSSLKTTTILCFQWSNTLEIEKNSFFWKSRRWGHLPAAGATTSYREKKTFWPVSRWLIIKETVV